MARRVRIWQLCVALVLANVSVLTTARGQLPATHQQAHESEPRVVFVRASTALRGAESLVGLEAQLGELSARIVSVEAMGQLSLASQAFRASELAREQGALGTVWFDESEAGRLRVFVYDAKHHKLTTRSLAGPDAAAREELAVVLRSAISALIAGLESELEPVTIPPPAPAPPRRPPVPAPSASFPGLFLGGGYAGTTYAAGTVQHGFALSTGVDFTRRIRLALSGIFLHRLTLAGGGAEAELARYPAELSLGYAFAENPRFRCYATLGAVLERVKRSTHVTDPRLSALPDDNRYRFALAPGLLALFGGDTGLLGFTAFGADVATDHYDYVVHSVSGTVRLAARAVRPRLEAGAVFRFK